MNGILALLAGAVLVSIAGNFWLDNRLAFGDPRLRGFQFLAGLSRFAVLCAFGAVANVAVTQALNCAGVDRRASALAGIVAGAVCNDVAVASLVWRT